MMRSFIRVAAAAGTLLLGSGGSGELAAQDPGPSPLVTVSGEVVDETSGRGLPGALVQVYPSGPRDVTDADGAFQLRLRPGEYVVIASLLGHGEQRLAVTATPGEAEPLAFRLKPEPLLLEGIEVTGNQFERRRQMVPMSSRVVERDRLARSGGENLTDFLFTWGGMMPTECPRDARSIGQKCVYRRGQVIEPRVYIDDQIAMGGMDALSAYRPWQVHHAEVYGRGLMIRIYTLDFVEALARGERSMSPLMY